MTVLSRALCALAAATALIATSTGVATAAPADTDPGAAAPTLWEWGHSYSDILFDKVDSSVPVPVAVPAGDVLTQVSTGNGYSTAVTTTGELLQLGALADYSFPVDGPPPQVDSLTPVSDYWGETPVQSADVGPFHSLAITNGRVLAWGYCETYGSLTDLDPDGSCQPDSGNDDPGMLGYIGVTEPDAVQVASGNRFSLALTTTGVVIGCGIFSPAGSGKPPVGGWQIVTELPPADPIVAIAASDDETGLALGKSGHVYEIGTRAPLDSSGHITPLDGLSGVTSLTDGVAVTGDGSVFTFDATETATGTDADVAQVTGFPADAKIVQAIGADDFAGRRAYIARSADGRVFTWGSNTHGQLGNGTLTSSTTPALVTGIPAGTVITDVAASDGLVFALAGPQPAVTSPAPDPTPPVADRPVSAFASLQLPARVALSAGRTAVPVGVHLNPTAARTAQGVRVELVEAEHGTSVRLAATTLRSAGSGDFRGSVGLAASAARGPGAVSWKVTVLGGPAARATTSRAVRLRGRTLLRAAADRSGGHLIVRGSVRTPRTASGWAPVSHVAVAVQRFVHGRWVTVRVLRTNARGVFATTFGSRLPGRLRVTTSTTSTRWGTTTAVG